MRHFASPRFWEAYESLPDKVRAVADKSFDLLKADPKHPSLHFKRAGRYWSARVGLQYRALAIEVDGDLVWFWIGSHADYDRLEGGIMPSETYRLFREAILGEKQVVCVYQGHTRELCPVIIGHTSGQEKVLAFQFGGQSSKTLLPGGEWRCLYLSQVEEAELREGPWREGTRHKTRQTCVEDGTSTSTSMCVRAGRVEAARASPHAAASAWSAAVARCNAGRCSRRPT